MFFDSVVAAFQHMAQNLHGVEDDVAQNIHIAEDDVAQNLHSLTSDVANDITGSEASLESGIGETVDSASNAASRLHEKTHAMTKAEIAHKNHMDRLGVVWRMFLNSVRVKGKIMVPGFVASLLVPTNILRMAAPVFGLFGLYLGKEAVDKLHEQIESHRKHPHKHHALHEPPPTDVVLDEPVLGTKAVQALLKKEQRADRNMTIELTAAVISATDDYDWEKRAGIMVGFAGSIVVVAPVLMAGLIVLEDWGQRLQAWEPQTPGLKQVARTNVPAWVGLGMEETAPFIKNAVLPWVGAAAKFVTSGRVISHAYVPFEDAVHQTATMFADLPYVGSEIAGNMGVWGATGVAAGVVASGSAITIKTLWKHTAHKLLSTNISRSLLINHSLLAPKDANPGVKHKDAHRIDHHRHHGDFFEPLAVAFHHRPAQNFAQRPHNHFMPAIPTAPHRI